MNFCFTQIRSILNCKDPHQKCTKPLQRSEVMNKIFKKGGDYWLVTGLYSSFGAPAVCFFVMFFKLNILNRENLKQ